MTRKSSLKATYLLVVVLVGGFMIWPLASRVLKLNDMPITVPFSADPASSDSDIYVTIPPTLPRTLTLPTPLFAPDSAWNQTATTAAVLPTGDQQILVTYRVLRGDTTDLHPTGEPPPTTWPFIDVGYDEFTIPVFRAGAGQSSVRICDYDGNLGWPGPKFPLNEQLEGGPVTVPPPAASVRPAMPLGAWSDGHVVLYDVDTFTEYDYWQATTVRDGECQSQGSGLIGSTIYETGAIDFFDVRGAGVNSDTFSSARATGPPLLAGLILPEDVESGAIEHALEFAIPGPRNLSGNPFEPLASDYVYPASTTETDYYSTNPNALAAGQRIRLKPRVVDENCNPINENNFAPITRMFLTALRTYGAYLVDNAGGFTFNAEEISSAVLDLTDDEINGLIGQSSGTPLPANKTRWQIVMETLNEDLWEMPFACGPWTEGQLAATAMITTANFEVVEPATIPGTTPSFYLTTDPSSRAIDPGGVATYTIDVGGSGGFTATVYLDASSPSPDLDVGLIPNSVDPPGQVTLIVTDSHPGPTLFPGQWYIVPITATNGVTQTSSVGLLVGGARVYLPLILKSFPSLSGLSAVNDFLYQLQTLDLAAIGNTAYDLVVMDYSAGGAESGAFTVAQITTLEHSPGGDKIVLAYMSIGEAEDYRFYWQSGWTPGNPAWLDAENPNWSGNYKVHYWDPAWQTIVFSYTDRLLDAGFDGAYLDIIDAYAYYEDQGRTTAAQEMADFVAAIRAHARARDPDFYIFPQNAPELAGAVLTYLDSVDGIGQEDIYYGYDNDDVMTPIAATAELEGYLDLFKNAAKLVLTVDYATTPAHVDDAYAKSQTKGYVPFVTVRDLDQLIINPGHEPD